jgi:hypothetical protein
VPQAVPLRLPAEAAPHPAILFFTETALLVASPDAFVTSSQPDRNTTGV